MTGRLVLATLLTLVCLGSWQSEVGATLYRLRFQINTLQKPSNPTKSLTINIQVADSEKRAYDAVSSVTVTAPGSTTPVELKDYWSESAQAFTILIPVTEETAPAGTYTAVVKGPNNLSPTSQITQTVTIDGEFLPLPTNIIVDNSTGVLTPTLKWDPVAGADQYNLTIQQTSPYPWSTSFPAYPASPWDINAVKFTVPAGVLKSGSSYTVTVNAFDSDKLITKQSQAVLSFTTP